jgi:hypothetical protein
MAFSGPIGATGNQACHRACAGPCRQRSLPFLQDLCCNAIQIQGPAAHLGDGHRLLGQPRPQRRSERLHLSAGLLLTGRMVEDYETYIELSFMRILVTIEKRKSHFVCCWGGNL